MRIALVHDYLVQDGGAERVLRAFQETWPDAPTFTLLYASEKMDPLFMSRDIRTSFLQRLPFATRAYKWLMPLMPAATESYDLSGYGVVLSTTSAFAKGVLTRPETLHVCYCHTPTRYLWSDAHDYLQSAGIPGLLHAPARSMLSSIRTWDRLAADRVDRFIANSDTVRARIAKYYRRESDIINPPVDVSAFRLGRGEGGYYLAGGRLVGYKRFDIIVQAFNRLGLPLKVFGDGPEAAKLRRMAGRNITFLGRVSEQEKAALYAGAIAYLNPQEEDFGITAIEAMASGRPVIAYRRGGAIETVVEGVTGTFIDRQDWESLYDAVLRFDHSDYHPETIREHARHFDGETFKSRIRHYVEDAFARHRAGTPHRVAERLPFARHESHRDRHPTAA